MLSEVWSLDKLALIARQPKRIQEQLRYMVSRNGITSNYSMANIETAISRLNRDLSGVIFDVTECAKCPENTITQELLFDDVTGGGFCMNEHCWMRKTIAACREILKKEKLIPIRGSGTHYGEQDCEFADKLKARYGHEYAEYRDPKDGETANALVISGPDIGKRMIVTARAKQPTRTVTAADEVRAEAEKQPPTVKEMEETLARKRNKKALQLLTTYVTTQYSAEKWMAKIPAGEALSHLLTVLKLYGYIGEYMHDSYCRLTPYDSKDPTEIDDIRTDVYEHAYDKIRYHLNCEIRETLYKMNQYAIYGVARLLRIEDQVKDIYDRSIAEVPEPKALTEAKPSPDPSPVPVAPAPDAPAPDAPVQYVRVREVHVRSAPGDHYISLGTVRPGARLPYQGETHADTNGANWFLVEYDGQNGWLCENDAEVIEK